MQKSIISDAIRKICGGISCFSAVSGILKPKIEGGFPIHMKTIITGLLYGGLLFVGIIAFFVIYCWVQTRYHALKDRLFEKYGETVNGTIKDFYCFVCKEDIEYKEYHIEYEYSFEGKIRTRRDWFLINAAHLEWANRGGLIGYPRIRFTEKDIIALIEPGRAIEIRLLPLLPGICEVCYPQIIRKAFEF